MLAIISGLFSLFLLSNPAHAIMTVQESAEITPLGNYKVGIAPQGITSDGGGFNLAGFFDAPINDQASYRLHLGTGKTDFFGGGSVKWTPFPDFENQPAIAGRLGLIGGRDENVSMFILRFDPIISKKVESDIGLFVPYGSIPINHITIDGTSETTVQLVGGSEFISNRLENVTFGAEVGFDMKDSFSYVSGFATIYLDEGAVRGQ